MADDYDHNVDYSTTSSMSQEGIIRSHEDETLQKEEQRRGNHNNNNNGGNKRSSSSSSSSRPSFPEIWTTAVEALSLPIKRVILALTHHAATHPYLYVVGIIIVSLGIVTIGFQTNFYMESNENELWKPIGSQVAKEGEWVSLWDDSNEWTFFDEPEAQRRLMASPDVVRRLQQNKKHHRQLMEEGGQGDGNLYITAILHQNGDNVVTKEGATRLFDIHQVVIETPGYSEYCAEFGAAKQCPNGLEFVCSQYEIPVGEDAPMTCERFGPTGFFLNNLDNFNERATSDEEVQEAMSINIFPGAAERFSLKNIIAWPEFDDRGHLVSGISYTTVFVLDSGVGGEDLSRNAVDRLLALRDKWANDDSYNSYSLELFATTGFPDEFQRGIVKDIPLIPLAFVIMSLFTMLVFYERDWVQSRSTLGFGAVSCVLLSIMSGYGLLFCFGTPFTALTQLLPFIMFGIGLDDAFILMTAYKRTDPSKSPVERVHDTIDEVGMSIFMTTATSSLAFGLGCTSTIPAIRWLCLYAFPTIAIDFIYQITFFVALIVIDEQRIQNRRKDWLCCCAVPEKDEEGEFEGTTEEAPREKHLSEKFMIAYSEFILKPWVKVTVLVVFTGLFAISTYSTTLLKVAFDFTSVLPNDSYLKDFNDAMVKFAQIPSVTPVIYFRFADQSDPDVLVQMEEYVNELVERIDGISSPPFHFWVRDYKTFMEKNYDEFFWLPFNETLHMFLNATEYQGYRDDFLFDSQGNIKASKTKVELDNIDLTVVDDYLVAYRTQYEVGSEQPLNQDGDWAFFNFDTVYYLWEFLNSTTNALISSTIYGIGAVSLMTILLMPHWTAVLMLAPMITVLYIDLMGFLQVCGVTINGVSYIAFVMSIGLLVDFIMHVALRYYESTEKGRVEKTKEVLRTMGTSILLGGLSTFLGTMPLAFASNGIFNTIFITFIGIVLVGISHGLILFPVILSMVGPQ